MSRVKIIVRFIWLHMTIGLKLLEGILVATRSPNQCLWQIHEHIHKITLDVLALGLVVGHYVVATLLDHVVVDLALGAQVVAIVMVGCCCCVALSTVSILCSSLASFNV